MRAVVIDPVEREVREVEIKGTLTELQGLVGGYIELVPVSMYTPQLSQHHMYVNEEGRLSPDIAVHQWSLKGWPEAYLCGAGVLLTSGGDGSDRAATVALQTVRELVTWA